jgi:hypothetical protein
MSGENLPLPTPGVLDGGLSTDSILAQFYRVAPTSANNINIPIMNAATKVFLPIGSYNNVQGPTGVTFPDNNSVMFSIAGLYTHTIAIYMLSDVHGLLGIDIVDGTNTQYSSAAFSIKDVAPSSAEPILLTAVLNHTPGQIAKIRLGGASPGDLGIIPSIWSVSWSIKR